LFTFGITVQIVSVAVQILCAFSSKVMSAYTDHAEVCCWRV